MAPSASDLGAYARRLVRATDRAALATRLPGEAGDGWPYASLVLVAADLDGSPLLLISDLAEHTRNAAADARAALLFDGTAGLANPLTGRRLTVLGRLVRDDTPRRAARFISRHPSAAEYANFGDFHLWRMEMTRAHLVAGFGRIDWIDGAALRAAVPNGLAEAEAGIIAHMNDDHAEAINLYATRLLGRTGSWAMTGIDGEGLDLRQGGAVARLEFDAAMQNAADARAILIKLTEKARAAS